MSQQIKDLNELKAKYRSPEQIESDNAQRVADSIITNQFALQLNRGDKSVSFSAHDIGPTMQPHIQLIIKKIEEFGISMLFNDKTKLFEATLIKE